MSRRAWAGPPEAKASRICFNRLRCPRIPAVGDGIKTEVSSPFDRFSRFAVRDGDGNTGRTVRFLELVDN